MSNSTPEHTSPSRIPKNDTPLAESRGGAPHRPTAVITGHMNADFDALAAMVAAGKIYPEATLVAPSMLERQTSHEFLETLTERFAMRQPKECDFSAVTLLVVVDTHQTTRIAHVKEILDNPGLEIHVYDHHPDSTHDLPAAYSVLKSWGSTTTILAREIENKHGCCLSTDEATMMGLGIFEDTGSFSFNSTTEHDFSAAAFLRRCGMDLSIITTLLSTELTAEQIHILDTMLRNAVTHNIQGIPITVTELVLEDFIGDLSSLVHKLMEMENLKAIFALAVMGDRLHMIARSRIAEVDVRQICASFGGGGHTFAASASIKNQPLAETRAELLALLVSSITPQLSVGQHMTAPAVSINNNQTMGEAVEVMNRFGLKAVPILDSVSRQCVGILEQQTATRAATHQLGGQPVTEYMQRTVRTLTPEADLFQAMEIILKQRQRLIPVLEENALVGVLTRTDVMRLLVDDTLHIPEGTPLTQEHRERNVAKNITDQLPDEHVRILRLAGTLGDSLGLSVFAVGGFVRDLILKQPNLDIDLSVEGDAPAFANALAERLSGHVRTHPKFKTAIVFYKDAEGKGQRVDIATARLEYYEHPAALPTVELASIKMDLYRRDFTINALAIQLNERRFGTLIDPFNAQRDIREKNIAVLHSLSFVEDPTRILRAVRFERRFDFRIGTQAERLIKNALSLNMMERLSGSRLHNELIHVFDEKEAAACIRRLESWGVWKSIHPTLRLTPAKDILLSSLEESLAWYRLLYKTQPPRAWVVYLLGLCSSAKYPEVSSMLDRLGFIEKAKSEFLAQREQTRSAAGRLITLQSTPPVAMSALHAVLSPICVEGLLLLMARYGHKFNIGQDISLFLTRLREISIDITGEDLAKLGEAPGPLYSEVLQHVLREKLDGIVTTREEQLEAAHRFIIQKREGTTGNPDMIEVLLGRL